MLEHNAIELPSPEYPVGAIEDHPLSERLSQYLDAENPVDGVVVFLTNLFNDVVRTGDDSILTTEALQTLTDFVRLPEDEALDPASLNRVVAILAWVLAGMPPSCPVRPQDVSMKSYISFAAAVWRYLEAQSRPDAIAQASKALFNREGTVASDFMNRKLLAWHLGKLGFAKDPRGTVVLEDASGINFKVDLQALEKDFAELSVELKQIGETQHLEHPTT